jgi:hypothetical protein
MHVWYSYDITKLYILSLIINDVIKNNIEYISKIYPHKVLIWNFIVDFLFNLIFNSLNKSKTNLYNIRKLKLS